MLIHLVFNKRLERCLYTYKLVQIQGISSVCLTETENNCIYIT